MQEYELEESIYSRATLKETELPRQESLFSIKEFSLRICSTKKIKPCFVLQKIQPPFVPKQIPSKIFGECQPNSDVSSNSASSRL